MQRTALAESTVDRLAATLRRRRANMEHAAASLEQEAFEAIETTDLSDLLDEDDPDTNGVEEVLLIAENVEEMLRSIDRALERVAAGSYGWCEECGVRIPLERLRAIPETPMCVDCARRRSRRA